jgi:hypothetical protein
MRVLTRPFLRIVRLHPLTFRFGQRPIFFLTRFFFCYRLVSVIRDYGVLSFAIIYYHRSLKRETPMRPKVGKQQLRSLVKSGREL